MSFINKNYFFIFLTILILLFLVLFFNKNIIESNIYSRLVQLGYDDSSSARLNSLKILNLLTINELLLGIKNYEASIGVFYSRVVNDTDHVENPFIIATLYGGVFFSFFWIISIVNIFNYLSFNKKKLFLFFFIYQSFSNLVFFSKNNIFFCILMFMTILFFENKNFKKI